MNGPRHLLAQRVLVTGASGFIGAHLCRALCAEGAEVHAISRSPQTVGPDGLRWWQGDLARIETAMDVVASIKPSLIFHLASYVKGARHLEAVLPALHDGLVGTVNVLTAATKIGCERIVLAGSLEEPEPGQSDGIPSSPYAAAKFAASAYARMFRELYRTPVVTARLFMVYGPAQRDLTKLVPYVTLSLLRGEPLQLTSGTRLVDWIYVDDVIRGLMALAHAPSLEGRVVDLGSGNLVTVRELVERLNQLTGSRSQLDFGNVPDRPMERVRVADVAATRAQLGWKPTITLEDGLKRTVDWYRDQLAQLRTS
jgi:nucleoside-diphosphate-sugar epimerase